MPIDDLSLMEAMTAERDRFAHENAELRSQIGHLKAQVRGEQEAKDEALRKLAATSSGWDATFRTKDALALIAIEEDVLKIVRSYLTTLTNDEREKFFYEVERGYCAACGRKVDDGELQGCQCSNDE